MTCPQDVPTDTVPQASFVHTAPLSKKRLELPPLFTTIPCNVEADPENPRLAVLPAFIVPTFPSIAKVFPAVLVFSLFTLIEIVPLLAIAPYSVLKPFIAFTDPPPVTVISDPLPLATSADARTAISTSPFTATFPPSFAMIPPALV